MTSPTQLMGGWSEGQPHPIFQSPPDERPGWQVQEDARQDVLDAWARLPRDHQIALLRELEGITNA